MACCASEDLPSEITHVRAESLLSKDFEDLVEETKKGAKDEKPEGAAELKTDAAAEAPAEVLKAEPLTTGLLSKLVVTFEAKGAGKETEFVFDTQPLPFDCKAESKCFCAGKSGRFAVNKVDPKRAQQYYDLKPGMLIKKLDGAELPIDLDWPEFQKLLATRTKQMKEAASEPPKEAAAEAPKETAEEATSEAAAAATQEQHAETPAMATKEETAETAAAATKEETADAPRDSFDDRGQGGFH